MMNVNIDRVNNADFSLASITVLQSGTWTFVPASSITVTGSITTTPGGVQAVISASSFPISNLPALQNVSIISSGSAANPWYVVTQGTFPISGQVSISNFPASQPVEGTVAATQSGVWVFQPSVSSGTSTNPFYVITTSTFPVAGSVAVTNFPTSQTVDGTVSVGNFPASQAVAVVNSSIAASVPIRCVKADGSAFESCAGGAASDVTYVSIVSSGTAGNPLFVDTRSTFPVSGAVTVSGAVSVSNFPTVQPVVTQSSQAVYGGSLATPIYVMPTATVTVQGINGGLQVMTNSTITVSLAASGTGVTLTGNSLNVNCTGGCGSASQAATFIGIATGTLLNNATHFCINLAGGSKRIEVHEIKLMSITTATYTGTVANFRLYWSSAASGAASNAAWVSTFPVSMSDMGTLVPQLTITARGGFTHDARWCTALAAGYQQSTCRFLDFARYTPDESAVAGENHQYILYEFKNRGEKPLTLPTNTFSGLCVVQEGVATTVGTRIAVRAVFTQQ